jgi:hypothetical protein
MGRLTGTPQEFQLISKQINKNSTNDLIYSKSDYKLAIPYIILTLMITVAIGYGITAFFTTPESSGFERIQAMFYGISFILYVILLLFMYYPKQIIIFDEHGIQHVRRLRKTIFIPWDNIVAIKTYRGIIYDVTEHIHLKFKNPSKDLRLLRYEHTINYLEKNERIKVFKKMAEFAEKRNIEIIHKFNYLSK